MRTRLYIFHTLLSVSFAANLVLYDGGFLSNSSDEFQPVLGGSWAVGSQGSILSNFGGGWRTVGMGKTPDISPKPDIPLYSPEMSLRGGFWAAGSWGTIARNSGGQWRKWWASSKDGKVSRVNLEPDKILYNPPEVFLRGGSYMLGDDGSILRDSGGGWEFFLKAPTQGKKVFDLLWKSSEDKQIFVEASNGAILALDLENLKWCTIQTPSYDDILKIKRSNGYLWALGSNKNLFRWSPLDQLWKSYAVDIEERMGNLFFQDFQFQDFEFVSSFSLWVSSSNGKVLEFELGSNLEFVLTIKVHNLSDQTAVTSLNFVSVDFGIALAGQSIYHWNGINWILEFSASNLLSGVSIHSNSRIWCVGENGTVLVWNGDLWNYQQKITNANLHSVSSPNGLIAGDQVSLFSDWTGSWKLKSIPSFPNNISWISVVSVGVCLSSAREEIFHTSGNISFAIRAEPTFWHDPIYTLYCGDRGERQDFSKHEYFQFKFRSEGETKNLFPTLKLTSWNAESNEIPILDYLVESKIISSQWTLVRIPLSKFKTSSWGLFNVERIILKNLTLSNRVFLSDIRVTNSIDVNEPYPSTSEAGVLLSFTNAHIRSLYIDEAENTVWACGDSGSLLMLEKSSDLWMLQDNVTLNNLYAIGALKGNNADIWAVGSNGTIFRKRRSSSFWDQVYFPWNVDLRAFASISSEQVWIASSSGIFFYDGLHWVQQHSSHVNSIYAVSKNFVIACGNHGLVLVFDESTKTWTNQVSNTKETLWSIWGDAIENTWIVGSSGTILKFIGGKWLTQASPTKLNLYSVFRTAAVGQSGVTIHLSWNGKWTLLNGVQPGVDGLDLWSVTGREPCLFYSSEILQGKEYMLEFFGDNWHGPNYRLFCGGYPRLSLCYYDTLEFKMKTNSSRPVFPTISLESWNHQSKVINILNYLVEDTCNQADFETSWCLVSIPLKDFISSDKWDLWNVETLSIGNISSGCSLSFPGPKPLCDKIYLKDIYVKDRVPSHEENYSLCSESDYLLRGIEISKPVMTPNFELLSISRTFFSPCESARPKMNPFCPYDSILWASGRNGTILRHNPRDFEWVQEKTGTSADLYDIASLNEDRVFAIGEHGTFLVFDGASWSLKEMPSSNNLYDFTIVTSSMMFCVGDATILMTIDSGITWSSASPPLQSTWRSVSGSPPDEFLKWDLFIVVVGDNGKILHSANGIDWVSVPSPTTVKLNQVRVFNPNNAWAVGNNGTILRWQGLFWEQFSSPTSLNLLSIDGTHNGNEILATGESGIILSLNWSGVFVKENISQNNITIQKVNTWGHCLFFADQVLGKGFNNRGSAIILRSDNWHVASIKLYCGSSLRRDFSLYDSLTFMIRSVRISEVFPIFHLATWNQESNRVPLIKFTEGGVVDTNWRRVSIPLTALKKKSWSLGNVQDLVFSNISSGCNFADRDSYLRCDHIFIDDIQVLDLTPPEIVNWAFESNLIIRLTLNEPYDLTDIKSASHYTLVSSSDSRYFRPLHPVDIGIYYEFTGFSSGSSSAENRYDFFLELPYPLIPEMYYTLKIHGLSDESGNVMQARYLNITWNPYNVTSKNIKLNVNGFLPEFPKHGYVGGYTGDLGGMKWAVGRKGVTYIAKKHTWTKMQSPILHDLNSVSGLTEKFAFSVGNSGSVIKWNGTRWEAQESVTAKDLLSIHCGLRGTCFAVGKSGTAILYNKSDSKWHLTLTNTTNHLHSVFVGPLPVQSNSEFAYAVGDNGTLLKWEEFSWLPYPKQFTSCSLRSIASRTTNLIIVGDCGTVLYHSYGNFNNCTINNEELSTKDLVKVYSDAQTSRIWLGTSDGQLWQVKNLKTSPSCTLDAEKVLEHSEVSPITGIQHVSMEFCGYYPRRRNCISMMASVKDTIYYWPSNRSTWGNSVLLSNMYITDISAVPFGILRIDKSETLAFVIDSDNFSIVHQSPLELRAANWHLSGEDVYLFNFSEFKSTGLFRIFIPSLGVSEAFWISDAALDFVAYTAARGLYYQRCGLFEGHHQPYSDPRFIRAPCHDSHVDGSFHPSIELSDFYNNEIINTSKVSKDVSGGFHDAGDYNKYIPTAAELIAYLIQGWDINSSKFLDDHWNIPESGNGIPDLLDDAIWEVDWMIKLQDTSDGGMYHKVSSCNWFFGMPEQESIRYIFSKSVQDTAFFVASAAAVGRAIIPFNSTKGHLYIFRAELGWKFLNKFNNSGHYSGFENAKGCHTGSYGDIEDRDNRLWAAAELYRATGKEDYRIYFEENYMTPGIGGNGVSNSRLPDALWAYALTDYPKNSLIYQYAKNHFIRQAERVESLFFQNAYLSGNRYDVNDWIGWGSFTYGTQYALSLLRGWKLTRNEDFLRAAYINIDTQLGAHPLSMSFITGIGSRHPRRPTCEICKADNIDEPYPGIPVFGSFHHLSNGHIYYVIVQNDANNFPYVFNSDDDRPSLRRFVDHWQVIPQAEFTIASMGHTLVVFNLLASHSSLPKMIFQSAIARSWRADSIDVYLARSNSFAQSNQGFNVSCIKLFSPDTIFHLGPGIRCFVHNSSWLSVSGITRHNTLHETNILKSKAPIVGWYDLGVEDFSSRVTIFSPPYPFTESLRPEIQVLINSSEVLLCEDVFIDVFVLSGIPSFCSYFISFPENIRPSHRLQDFLSKQTSVGLLIPSDFISSGSYEISVFCTNYIGFNSKTHFVNLSVAPWYPYDLKAEIVSGPNFKILENQWFRSAAKIDVSSKCKIALIPQLYFHWQLYSGRSLLLTSKSRIFEIPPYFLNIHGTYDIFLWVWNSRFSNASLNATIEVLSSPIFAIIIGGNRQVSKNSMIVLDGSKSLDLGLDPSPFSYQWTCRDLGQSNDVCLDNNRMEISFPKEDKISFQLSFLGEYEFKLFIWKNNQSSETSIVIQVVDDFIPFVSIDASSYRVNPGEKLILYNLADSKEQHASWDLFEELSTSSTQPRLSTSKTLKRKQSSLLQNVIQIGNAILIPEGSLQPSTQLTAFLKVRDSFGNLGIASVIIPVSEAPSPCSLHVEPLTGIAFETFFLLRCDVVDPATVLIQYQYQINDGIRIDLNAPSIPQALNFSFPSGNITIYGYSFNDVGASSISAQTFYVAPSEHNVTDVSLLQSMLEIILISRAANDRHDLGGRVAVFSYFLDTLENSTTAIEIKSLFVEIIGEVFQDNWISSSDYVIHLNTLLQVSLSRTSFTESSLKSLTSQASSVLNSYKKSSNIFSRDSIYLTFYLLDSVVNFLPLVDESVELFTKLIVLELRHLECGEPPLISKSFQLSAVSSRNINYFAGKMIDFSSSINLTQVNTMVSFSSVDLSCVSFGVLSFKSGEQLFLRFLIQGESPQSGFVHLEFSGDEEDQFKCSLFLDEPFESIAVKVDEEIGIFSCEIPISLLNSDHPVDVKIFPFLTSASNENDEDGGTDFDRVDGNSSSSVLFTSLKFTLPSFIVLLLIFCC